MTMQQLYHLKPLLNFRLLADAAGLSYAALTAKLYRYGARGRKSELTAPESAALDAALARLLHGAGLVVVRPTAVRQPAALEELIYEPAYARASAGAYGITPSQDGPATRPTAAPTGEHEGRAR